MMKMIVDGDIVFTGKGDYKDINGSVGVFSFGKAKVAVQSLFVSSGKSLSP